MLRLRRARAAGLALALCAWLALPGESLALDPTPLRALPATGTIEPLFSPWQDTEARIVELIGQARREIFMQAFLFTSRPIAAALIEAHQRGVKVEVLADIEMNGKGDRSQIPLLAAAGLPVLLETRYSSAHNKVILIDPREADSTLITGSYNFTFSARMKNAENTLVLRGNPALASAYLANWQRHRRDATPWALRESASERAPETWKPRPAND
ncbi:MAG: hypothetical protein RIR70_1050 [Pseudomonadota bacterium]|jgi:phosphatidylserine/phosphatidylglycerophosphate/cardiolipin synthase-like enzyme